MHVMGFDTGSSVKLSKVVSFDPQTLQVADRSTSTCTKDHEG